MFALVSRSRALPLSVARGVAVRFSSPHVHGVDIDAVIEDFYPRRFDRYHFNPSGTWIWIDGKSISELTKLVRDQNFDHPFLTFADGNTFHTTASIYNDLTSSELRFVEFLRQNERLIVHESSDYSGTFKIVSELWLKNGSIKVDELIELEPELIQFWEIAKAASAQSDSNVFLLSSPKLRNLLNNPETRPLAFVTHSEGRKEPVISTPEEYFSKKVQTSDKNSSQQTS